VDIAAFKPLQPEVDLKRPVSIVAERARQFLMDHFCAPPFHPKSLNDESLFLFVHIIPITVLINASQLELPFYSLILFLDICHHDSSYRGMVYVIVKQNPYEERPVQRWRGPGTLTAAVDGILSSPMDEMLGFGASF
jgi:hypothetical protein